MARHAMTRREVTAKGPARRTFLAASTATVAAMAVAEATPAQADASASLALSPEVSTTAFSGTLTRKIVPAFDTKRLVQGASLYTPIWSDKDAIYIADSTPILPWDRTATPGPKANFIVTRIPKDGSTPTTATVGNFFYDKTNVGHRGASVVVSDDGRVLAHPAVHSSPNVQISVPLAVFRSRASHDISGFDLLETASGGFAGSSYRRFFRDPNTRGLYMLVRGTLNQSILWRWDKPRQNFERMDRPGTAVDVWDSGRQDGLNLVNTLKTVPDGKGGLMKVIDKAKTGGYGHEVAFVASGSVVPVIYCVPEFTVNSAPGEIISGYPTYGQGGYPRRDIALVRSIDGGYTWQSLDLSGESGAVSYPVPDAFTPNLSDGTVGNVDIAFPGPTYDRSNPDPVAQDATRNNAVGARIAVSGNRVIVVANWDGRTPTPGVSDGLTDAQRIRGLYARTYDSVQKRWLAPVTTLIAPTPLIYQDPAKTRPDQNQSYHAGLASVVSTSDGRVVVIASDHDDHRLDGGGLVQTPDSDLVDDLTDSSGQRTPRDKAAGPFPSSVRLFAFVTREGANWTKYRLDDVAAAARTSQMTQTPAGAAFIDAPALERDGVIRLYPVFAGDPKRSELWEVKIPGFTDVVTPQAIPEAPLVTGVTMGNSINLNVVLQDDGGRTATKYRVYRGTTSKTAVGGTWAVVNDLGGVIDTNAPSGALRSYQVAAVDAAGTEGKRSPIIWFDGSNRTPARAPMPNALAQSGSFAPFTFTEKSPMMPSLIYRSDDVGARSDGSPLQTGDRIGLWRSSGTASSEARGESRAVNEARTNPDDNTDSRPFLVSGGPNGYPAVRFTRAAASRLLVERPTSITNDATPVTTFVVARLRDYDWNYLISSQAANGRMAPDQEHSRTNTILHETRFTDAGLTAAGVASPERIVHSVRRRSTTGRWVVYVSQWRTQDDVRRISGQITLCEGDNQEYPRWDAPTGTWRDRLDTLAPSVSSAPGTPAKYMTIGSVVDMAGTRLVSEVDIAEIIRFDQPMGRPDMRRIVQYLIARYALPTSILIPQDTSLHPADPDTPCQHFSRNADGTLNTQTVINCTSIAAWAAKTY
ncbi:hypothetical protein C5D16_07760 [Rathayibacter toxicus]|nr:hypothetical protein C5D15_07790 [Rathayibacter toxicus]PPG45517.1 hypothetical protein C5D16_07760 [Rathayibacter toxicus]PPH71492.1 hypothetical protein C5D24_07720 [Rathayibacter toxicus]PPI22079.1 hypothetical protein C5D55_07800 [Rathayibacter toxicus]PPI43935.1 hypothetical protein C5D43_07750 [Rathayibacter toxicus]